MTSFVPVNMTNNEVKVWFFAGSVLLPKNVETWSTAAGATKSVPGNAGTCTLALSLVDPPTA